MKRKKTTRIFSFFLSSKSCCFFGFHESEQVFSPSNLCVCVCVSVLSLSVCMCFSLLKKKDALLEKLMVVVVVFSNLFLSL